MGAFEARDRWNLFCRVVDNFGDVGIAWRLAKQLAAGGSRSVRLVVDDLAAFARIEPRVDPSHDRQSIASIAIERWPGFDGSEACATRGPADAESAGLASRPAEVVVEVLGCGLPSRELDAMTRSARPAVWIDLDHLSAEAWIDGFHGRPSPHPTLPLTKYFFYPGFGPDSGGLWIEPGFEERRRAFVDDASGVDAFFRRIGEPAKPGTHRLSLFAYDDAPVAGLLDALAGDRARRWSVLVPATVLAAPLAAWFDAAEAHAGATRTRGSLSVTTVPFLDQDGYDRLLWACDVNGVRGEDSFVRAQAAGRPMFWNVYPQTEGADERKRTAFEARYEAVSAHDARVAQRAFWAIWNDRTAATTDAGRAAVTDAAARWLATLPLLDEAAVAWRRRLLGRPPLVERLIDFVARRRSGT